MDVGARSSVGSVNHGVNLRAGCKKNNQFLYLARLPQEKLGTKSKVCMCVGPVLLPYMWNNLRC
jgi:hypothetical protein